MTKERYSRLNKYGGLAATLPVWRRSSVAVIGLGGLGSGLVQYLSRMGVGELVLVDRDVVGEENLGHQLLYTAEDAARALPKAVVAEREALAINPELNVKAVSGELNRLNIDEILESADLLFDGLDSYYTRMVVNEFALKSRKPYFYAGVVRGELSAKAIVASQTSCLNCLMPELPGAGEVPTCASEGVFPPLLAAANALQIDLANSVLAGEPVRDELISLKLPDWQFSTLDTSGLKGSCKACSRQVFEYLDGTRDHLAAAACAGDRFTLQLPAPVDSLEDIATALSAVSPFEVAVNRFCLSARAGKVRYTLFQDGRLLGEGLEDASQLSAFASEYLGI